VAHGSASVGGAIPQSKCVRAESVRYKSEILPIPECQISAIAPTAVLCPSQAPQHIVRSVPVPTLICGPANHSDHLRPYDTSPAAADCSATFSHKTSNRPIRISTRRSTKSSSHTTERRLGWEPTPVEGGTAGGVGDSEQEGERARSSQLVVELPLSRVLRRPASARGCCGMSARQLTWMHRGLPLHATFDPLDVRLGHSASSTASARAAVADAPRLARRCVANVILGQRVHVVRDPVDPSSGRWQDSDALAFETQALALESRQDGFVEGVTNEAYQSLPRVGLGVI
jgi:hypothetical protein